jgi:hypothetical protein
MVQLPFPSRIQPSTLVTLTACGVALAALGWARGPQGTPPAPNPTTPQTQALPMTAGGVAADSNDRMIAVTGVDVTGASVLYLVDTVNMRLAVYQANSSGSNQGVRLIGARRIELDLQLNAFHDNSEYSYTELKSKFEEQGLFK